MPLLVITTYPAPTDTKDINVINGILASIVDGFNGGIDEANVVAGTPIPIGRAGSVGSTAIALGDHGHAVQGFEELASDPTTGNFIGRTYQNTVSGITRRCISASGSGTYVNWNPLAASDLVAHAANHASGGSDELPDNAISAAMMGRGLAFNSVLPADAAMGNGSFATIWSGITFSCTGTQVVTFHLNLRVDNAAGTEQRVGLRLQEAGTDVWVSPPHSFNANTQSSYKISDAITLDDGSHTLTLQGFAHGSASVSAVKQWNRATETKDVSTMKVVVG